MQNRLPDITSTCELLGWRPKVDMQSSLRRIFEFYRDKVVEAQSLLEAAG